MPVSVGRYYCYARDRARGATKHGNTVRNCFRQAQQPTQPLRGSASAHKMRHATSRVTQIVCTSTPAAKFGRRCRPHQAVAPLPVASSWRRRGVTLVAIGVTIQVINNTNAANIHTRLTRRRMAAMGLKAATVGYFDLHAGCAYIPSRRTQDTVPCWHRHTATSSCSIDEAGCVAYWRTHTMTDPRAQLYVRVVLRSGGSETNSQSILTIGTNQQHGGSKRFRGRSSSPSSSWRGGGRR